MLAWAREYSTLGLLCISASAPAAGPAAVHGARHGSSQSSTQGTAQPGPPPCSAPEYRQFDFWIGSWTVKDPNGAVAGTNVVDRPYGDCVVQEHWVGAKGMVRGTSLNTYDPVRRVWHQTWVDNAGQLLVLEGRYTDDQMVLTGDSPRSTGKPIVNRIIWRRENGNPNEVRQRWEASTDGGKTWQVVFNGLYVRYGH